MFPDIIACENIRFSSLFAAGDVSRETSPSAKSEEKRMFLQATDISAIDVNRTGTILGYAKTCCLKSIARIDRMPLQIACEAGTGLFGGKEKSRGRERERGRKQERGGGFKSQKSILDYELLSRSLRLLHSNKTLESVWF